MPKAKVKNPNNTPDSGRESPVFGNFSKLESEIEILGFL